MLTRRSPTVNVDREKSFQAGMSAHNGFKVQVLKTILVKRENYFSHVRGEATHSSVS